MTKEQILLAVAGALIVLGLFVIVSALRRARRREQAIERVDALLTLAAEPSGPEPELDDPFDRPFREHATIAPRRAEAAPAPRPVRVATGHRYVITLSDPSGSFGVDTRR